MKKDKTNDIKLLGTLFNADESGIIANAAQIYDSDNDKSTEEVDAEQNKRLDDAEAKDAAMQITLEGIIKTGEASAASNVTYNHNDSQLDASNVQQAIDEVYSKSNSNVETTKEELNESLQDVYKKSNYNDGDEVIDFNSIHLVEDNPEYIAAWVDANDRLLVGIKKDTGSPYYGVGVPEQVKDYIDSQINKILGTDDITATIDSLKEIEAFLKDFTNSDTLKNLLDLKANVDDVTAKQEELQTDINDKYKKSNPNDEEGNIIDTNSIVSVEDNPEYIKALADSTNKLIEAIGLDGVRKFFAGIDIQGVSQCVTDNPEYIVAWLDSDDRIILAIENDGNPNFGYGVPRQIQGVLDTINSALTTALEDIDKKINLGNNTYPSNVHGVTDNPEYISALADAAEKLLEAYGVDGVRRLFTAIELMGTRMSVEDNPEFIEAKVDKDNKLLGGFKTDGDYVFGIGVPTQIKEAIKDITIDTSEFDAKVESSENASKEASDLANSVKSLLAGISAKVNTNETNITQNTSDIAELKKIDGFSDAKAVEDRISSVESDITTLKSTNNLGTDIISLNGGEDTIKQKLYGYKKKSFKSLTRGNNANISTLCADDSLVLLHFTDIHDDDRAAERIKAFVDKFKIIDGTTAIDDVIFTGDLVKNTYGGDLTVTKWADWGFDNYLFGIGNHDVVPGDTSNKTFTDGSGWGRMPCLQAYNKYIAPYVANWGVVQPDAASTVGKNYYYKDYSDLGYRLFMCDCFSYKKPYKTVNGELVEIENTFDYNYSHYVATEDAIGTITDATEGLIVYVGSGNVWSGYVIDAVTDGAPTSWEKVTFKDDDEYMSEQNTWLETELNNAKTLGYHCIITMHCTPTVTSAVAGSGAFNTLGKELPHYGNWLKQCKQIGVICDNFVAGGGVIPCMLCGHQHYDEFTYYNDILCVTLTCASSIRDDSDDIRVVDKKSEDAFNIVAFNKDRGVITIQRIGVDADSFNRGKHTIVYDYINKEIKYQY